MKYQLRIFLFISYIFFSLPKSDIAAQAIPVGSIQDQQMKIQLLLSDTLAVSPVFRPFSQIQYYELMTYRDNSNGWWNRIINQKKLFETDGVTVGIQPFVLQNTYNSRFPYSENNGAAWYGRGSTTEFQTGLFLESKYVTFTVHPHIIYQQNKDFLEPKYTFDVTTPFINEIGGNIDAPIRFGPNSYSTFDWGNSSLRFRYHKFETGISNEPLWWGGANRYPLMMSTNAPGVPHFFIGTREGVTIPYFGNINFRWLMGYPRESGYFGGVGSGIPRFMNTANISYTPKIFRNLTLGVTRTYHIYEDDGFKLSNVFLLFDPVRRSSLVERQGEDDIRQARNQMASAYFHLKIPAANAEIYAEFFREDHSFDFRDLLIQPHHNSAYSIGFQKISYTPLVDFIKTNVEITNLTTSQLNQVRPQAFFYSHDPVIQGHTNRGQILGAAIGPGSNSQFFGLDAFKNNYKFGFFAQRIADNDNLHLREGSASNALSANFGDYFRHRVNLNFGLNFLYGPGPFYINSRLVWTKAYNYGRFDYGRLDGFNATNYDRNDRTNVQFQIGLTYIL